MSHYQVVIVGGGTGGITVAARLEKALKKPSIAIIEPSNKHYYQPLWTLVGGGVCPKEESERNEASVIPKSCVWIRDYAESFDPENNKVALASGKELSYDYLVVAPGIQIDWNKIPGLKESLGKDGVCSNYAYEQAEKTWQFISNFKGGNAIFTAPSTPVKCGGAPQKIMYLADDAFRKQGIRDKTNVIAGFAGTVIFGVPEFAKGLSEVVKRKNIDLRLYHDLVELHPEKKEAVFKVKRPNEAESLETIPYEMIHVTPPQSSPDFIKHSPLANAAGWVDVDKHTLQHVKYKNIFGLGDASSLPTSRTGAAIRKQAPTLVQNLLALMNGKSLDANYDGYTSCPLVTGYGKLILAEFDYNNKPKPSFPIIDTTKERWDMYMLKRHGLPYMYWNLMLKGLA
ncbi:MAG: FAD/NAD(P)-binding oxidoreductase [Deinococcales bacterium]